jgi:hypothetical protein
MVKKDLNDKQNDGDQSAKLIVLDGALRGGA